MEVKGQEYLQVVMVDGAGICLLTADSSVLQQAYIERTEKKLEIYTRKCEV